MSAQPVSDINAPGGWESIWKDLQPGEFFDAHIPAPVLSAFLSSPLLPPGPLTALIPGCGRAYDVHLLASSPRFSHVTGVDISPTAVSRAEKFLQHKDVPTVKYTLLCTDFLDERSQPKSDPVDLAYDYTFLCAIPLTRRRDWASAYGRWVKSGGLLATLMFPMGKALETGGPPFGVTFDDYRGLLGEAGFECVNGPRVLQNEEAHEGRGEGKSAWAVWRKRD